MFWRKSKKTEGTKLSNQVENRLRSMLYTALSGISRQPPPSDCLIQVLHTEGDIRMTLLINDEEFCTVGYSVPQGRYYHYQKVWVD